MKQSDLSVDNLPVGLHNVLVYWQGLGGEDPGCSWNSFDLLSIPAYLLPTTMVIDVFPDMDQNRYRFWGSRMTAIHGRDMTGLSPYAIHPPELSQALRRRHEKTMHEGKPSADIFQFEQSSGIIHRHFSLRLPLSNDGQAVHQIVVVVDLSAEASDYMKSPF